MTGLVFRSHGMTDPGARRRLNEDSFVDRPEIGLWAVADGAGGHQAGEVASGLISQSLNDIAAGLSLEEMQADVRARLVATDVALREKAAELGRSAMIASTAVVLIAVGAEFVCLWIGDSRAYRLRGGVLSRLTRDHSLVQDMVDSGTITPEEAERHPSANVITRAVGAGENGLEIDSVTGELAVGDRFLLCSDGLSKELPETELAALLAGPDGVALPELFITATLARQGRDNVTAVTMEVGEAVSGGR